ncbi:MAG: CinA family protein [Proteobacteria bacterium]|nr:CinA family protein [Pseudomonadota bacterium]
MTSLLARLGDEIEREATAFLRRAAEHDWTVATAESCTGGLLASVLTDVEGFGHVFSQGWVTYTEESKIRMLGVGANLIEAYSAVSEPVARAMAEGARARSRADLAAAITGYAGRGAPDEPPGRVYMAVAARGQPTACRRLDLGDQGRTRVRLGAIEAALRLMNERLG